MDAVTRSLMKEFEASNSLNVDDEAVLFEHFCNYLITLDHVGVEFEVERIATGPSEFGIDGVAIIVNDTLIEDEEQLLDVLDTSKVVVCSFLFIQSKSATSFNAGEILKFTTAVGNFFFDNASLNKANKRLMEAHSFYEKIYAAAGKFTRGLPSVHMYYACTGVWKQDPLILPLLGKTEQDFADRNMFSATKVVPIDASRLQSLYFKSKNAIRAEVEIPVSVPLPEIKNVREAYIGAISAKEYFKLILDENGDVIKKIFFDNIRDFQGDTDVNAAIGRTLQSDAASQFAIRNNGITVVARNLHRVANKFVIEDYQIVNGCQSSHVLAANQGAIGDDVYCTIKIVNTDHEESIKEIIISSNRQNEISSDSFWILDDIHKKLEIYFEQQPSEAKLFYERRSGQFDMQGAVERTRIISKDALLKAFAAMFLAETNRVGRYYKDLLPQIRKTIFAPGDNLAPYHTSALAHWRLEFLFRAKRVDRAWKAFRYPLLLIARYIVEQERGLKRADRLKDAYCQEVNSYLVDVEKSAELFTEANTYAQQAVDEMGEEYSKRVAKMRDFKEKIDALFPVAAE